MKFMEIMRFIEILMSWEQTLSVQLFLFNTRLYHISITNIIEGLIVAVVGAFIIFLVSQIWKYLKNRFASKKLEDFSFANYIEYYVKNRKPEFFRFTGPIAVDFEEDYVYISPSVDKINKLKQKIIDKYIEENRLYDLGLFMVNVLQKQQVSDVFEMLPIEIRGKVIEVMTPVILDKL